VKKVYRHEDNADYWNRRWTEAGADAPRFTDLSIYPIKYARMVMTDPQQATLEIGAGLGRLVKHYHRDGYRITGVERSEVAVSRVKADDPAIDIRVGDVLALPFADATFDVVLAFGLYHNLETGMDRALGETARCLRPGGRFCISMRPDNVEMWANEWYWRLRQRRSRHQPRRFHKWLVKTGEFRDVLRTHGLDTEEVHYARNMSLLYRIPWLRERSTSEGHRRAAGYRLNAVGRVLDRALAGAFPSQFCNVLVYVGTRRA
jgi:SAM-dependent methyltransferase